LIFGERTGREKTYSEQFFFNVKLTERNLKHQEAIWQKKYSLKNGKK